MNIVKNKWIFFSIAGILILVSLVSLIFQGFNLDTDFAGGMAITYQIKSDFSTGDVEAIVNEALGQGVSASSVQQSGGARIIGERKADDGVEVSHCERSISFAAGRLKRMGNIGF